MDGKLSMMKIRKNTLKRGVVRVRVTWPTLNFDAPMISLEQLKLELSNFACRYTVLNPSLQWQTTPKGGMVRVTWPVFFKFCPNHVYVNGEARHFEFCIGLLIDIEEYECMHDILLWKGMCSESCDLFKFWEISDNISETVQDRDVVAMED